MSIEIHPRRLSGPWDDGYALDVHTLSSVPIGPNHFRHMQFDTKRSPVGELLYQLKYRGDQSGVEPLAEVAVAFVKPIWRVDAVVPVPPSTVRKSQPVMAMADAIAAQLGVPICAGCLTKVKQTPQLKDITDYDKRKEVLAGAFAVDRTLTADRVLLLFDDLHGSGATAGHVAEILKQDGKARAVYLLTLTTK